MIFESLLFVSVELTVADENKQLTVVVVVVVVILPKPYGTPFRVTVSILSVVLYHRPALMTMMTMMTEQRRCKLTLLPHKIIA